jgi:hypothetical protein
MRTISPRLVPLLLAVAAAPIAAQSDSAVTPVAAPVLRDDGWHLTLFRSPGTGVEWRQGRWGVHAAHYPTIVRAPGQARARAAAFVRVGAAWYARPGGWSPYVAPSVLVSLDRDWGNGVLTEAGVRLPVVRGTAIRAGVGVLAAFDGTVRVNPTIGVSLRLRRTR